MLRNHALFVPENPLIALEVRGFQKNGARSGGIQNPRKVVLPTGTILIRFFGANKSADGQWWNTLYELQTIYLYFGRSGNAFDNGRGQGKGLLHATYAVRHDWSSRSPLDLGAFVVVRLTEPLFAYWGEGDHAPDAGNTSVQKAATIVDRNGRQRRARQLFLPRFLEYKSATVELRRGATVADLERYLSSLSANALSFEI